MFSTRSCAKIGDAVLAALPLARDPFETFDTMYLFAGRAGLFDSGAG